MGNTKKEKVSQYIMLNGCMIALGCHNFVLTYGVEVVNNETSKTCRFWCWNEKERVHSNFKTEEEAKDLFHKLKTMYTGATFGGNIVSEGL